MEVIVKNKPKLIRWLSADPLYILQHVQSQGFITSSEYSELMSISVPETTVIKLLDIICGKGESVCRHFLILLKDDVVNEGSPELREWIQSVTAAGIEKTHKAGQLGIRITSHASGGSCTFAPVITQSTAGDININAALTSGRSDIARNYHKPQKDCERGESGNGSIPDDCWDFLRKNISDLVQNVKNINPVLDDLNLHPECAANVRVQATDQDKMRKLLDYVNCQSIAKRLVKALVKHEPDLMKDLLS